MRVRPAREVILASEALVLLGIARICLRPIHFQTIRKVLGTVSRAAARLGLRHVDLDTVLWATKAAKSRFPFRTTCLIEALTTEAMCKQQGIDTDLRIGVARIDGHFTAHAWLEKDDAVIVGGPESTIRQYVRFPNLDSAEIP